MIFSRISTTKLLAACSVDLILGDPHKLPHPVRLIGKGISAGERLLRRQPSTPAIEFLQGGVLTVVVVAGSWVGARLAIGASRRVWPSVGDLTEILLAWTTLATGSLLAEAGSVLAALDCGQLEMARNRLAMIVGRDTVHLEESEIARAVIETVAEGLCDGVVAPLTYLAIGGVPLSFAYKAVNTLDSMIGHPEPPYRYFGRVAARVDDVANFVPARLTAIAIVAAAYVTNSDWRGAWSIWRRDGDKHSSPNAGQSEAAMAGALNIRLGGLSYYDGKPSRKPYLGAGGPVGTRRDARASLRVARIASLLASIVALAWCFWRPMGEQK